MKELKEILENDIKIHTNLIEGNEKKLATVVIMDIMVKFMKLDKDEKKDFSDFDNMVEDMKKFLEPIDIKDIEIPTVKEMIKGEIDLCDAELKQNECAKATLTGVLELIKQVEENKKEEE